MLDEPLKDAPRHGGVPAGIIATRAACERRSYAQPRHGSAWHQPLRWKKEQPWKVSRLSYASLARLGSRRSV
jgi:hypothetical protein